MSTTLQHAEYYDIQKVFDDLYQRSENNATKGVNLYKYIISKENILLAYRSIKANSGSKTEGTDGITIDHYKMEDVNSFVDDIRKTLTNYKPNTVRRVEIPKPNGKKRPLGIPTMRDRLIHATNDETIRTYMRILQLNDKQLKKINKLRKACNLVTLV